MPTSVCTAKASYKKLPGTLQLTDTHLQWTQDGKSAPSVRVPNAEAASLFCSKAGAAQVRMKLALVGDDTGHNFTFTSPQPVALNEREKFKTELTTIIGRNKGAPDSTPRLPQTRLRPNRWRRRPKPSTSRAASVSSSENRATPILAGSDPAQDFRLRKTILLGNPELGTLHRELVIGGQITEAEFWEGREHLVLAQAAAESQRKGKPGQLVDPRPETVEGGEVKIRITPQLVHDIFDEYPVVAKAYSDTVPEKLSEEQFWKRYFQSKLFNAHRASIRSSATQHVVKADPIFDKYLEKDDDELEPRRQLTDEVELYVDLAATREDHEETGNIKDITMQAGRQRGALPLIRKFNEHSERLLNAALLSSGEGPPTKRRRVEDDAQIDLDDLHDPEASTGIILEMQDRQRYFEGRKAVNSGSARKNIDFGSIVREAKSNFSQWETDLAQLKLERKPGDAALLSMTQNVAARLDVRSKTNDLPDGFFRQMTSCQTAANEFLRQFWSATYPSGYDLSAAVTPAQKAAKATKMIGYLSKTHEKVEALVRAAQQQGLDANRIEIAMKPVLTAVDRALAFHRNKKVSRGS
ncbi:hypothetical protein IW261DRAFT_1548835 [Armillaria novae-zelandiae]|uniref:BSD domain-containing protein n=1 Tax=Armillaria novae-zelandiae TaxID=153914 RepID=A0AA39UG35_9AGAR|nr:hypothetical protein IW261DRAFT_1548835 [Armillaria novae-zelandiae]